MADTTIILRGHPADFPTRAPSEPRYAAMEVAGYLQACAGGTKNATGFEIITGGGAVAAVATITCAGVLAADTATVANIVFTAVAGTPTVAQFQVNADNAVTAANLATAINAHATANLSAIAVASGNSVNLTARQPGAAGNGLQLSSSTPARLLIVRFGGGSGTATARSYTFGG